MLALRQQSTPCGDGEPYLPIAVDHVLGRDDVVLRDGDGEVITTAPTADDLAAGGEEWALDLPGDALDPGCDYEEWFRSMDAEPAVYGRAVVDGEFLVAQYWLYYVYNDWNDRHESDWEMIQLVFDTPTVAEALEQGPVLYAYAQHEGSEYAFLDDAVGAGRGDGDGAGQGPPHRRRAGRLPRPGLARRLLRYGALVRQERRDGLRLRRHDAPAGGGEPGGHRAPDRGAHRR